MKKIFLSKKFEIFIVLIIMITVSATVILVMRDKGTDQNTMPDIMSKRDYSELVYMLLENDESAYDNNIIVDFIENHQDMKEDFDEDCMGIYHFINGMIAVHNYEENAQEELIECLKTYDFPYYKDASDAGSYNDSEESNFQKLYTGLEREIAARCYYELSRIAIDQENISVLDKYENNIETVLDTPNTKYYNVFIYTWYLSDVLKVENATDRIKEIAERAIEMSEECDYSDKGMLYSSVAAAYLVTGENVKFMEYELKALKIAEEKKDLYNQVICNNDIGYQYIEEGNYKKAKEYIGKAYDLLLEEDESSVDIKCYISSMLVTVAFKEKNQEDAIKYIDEMKKWNDQEEDNEIKRDDYTNYILTKAEYEYEFGDCNLAIKYLEEVMERFETASNFQYNNFDLDMYNLYGEVLQKMKKYDEAIEKYMIVYDISEERGMEKDMTCLEGLSDSYAMIGDTENSYKYSKELLELMESKLKDKSTQEANYLLEQFKSDKKDNQIITLENRQRRFIIAAIIAILLLILGTLQIWITRKNNKKIIYLSERDGLTDLYNRRKLDEYLDKKWDELKAGNVAILMVDVDHFKQYNDNYGHQKGDQVLVSISNSFRNCLDEEDFLARYGGEEFLLVLNDTDKERARHKIQDIYDDIKRKNIEHRFSTVSDRITISVGYSVFSASSEESYEQAIKKADDALYVAKENRNIFIEG